MPGARTAAGWAALLFLSSATGALLDWIRMPAAFLLGPMIVAVLFALNGVRLRLPAAAFVAAQSVLGCVIAQAITSAILVSILKDWPAMLLVVIATVLSSWLIGWAMVRFGTLPGTTAAWGVAPGAATAMVAAAEGFGDDPRLVAFMQYVRVLLVVALASLVAHLWPGAEQAATALPPTLPPAAPLPPGHGAAAVPVGHWVGTLLLAAAGLLAGLRSRIPAGGLLVPMLAGAALHAAGLLEPTFPGWLPPVAYGVFGLYIGLRFTRETMDHTLRIIPQVLLCTGAMIGLCALTAWMLAVLLRVDGLTAYLATSPGGLDSVAIIALGADVNVPFILAVQTLRFLVVVLTGPAVATLIARHAPRRPA